MCALGKIARRGDDPVVHDGVTKTTATTCSPLVHRRSECGRVSVSLLICTDTQAGRQTRAGRDAQTRYLFPCHCCTRLRISPLVSLPAVCVLLRRSVHFFRSASAWVCVLFAAVHRHAHTRVEALHDPHACVMSCFGSCFLLPLFLRICGCRHHSPRDVRVVVASPARSLFRNPRWRGDARSAAITSPRGRSAVRFREQKRVRAIQASYRLPSLPICLQRHGNTSLCSTRLCQQACVLR